MSVQVCFEPSMHAGDPEKYFWMAGLVSSSDVAEVLASCRPAIHHFHMLVLSHHNSSMQTKDTYVPRTWIVFVQLKTLLYTTQGFVTFFVKL